METTKLEPLFNLQELEAKLNGNGRAATGGMAGWDILSVDQFDRDRLDHIFGRAEEMRAMVERGDLGKIIHVQGHFFQDWLLNQTDYNW